jgi:hypothetical protein
MKGQFALFFEVRIDRFSQEAPACVAHGPSHVHGW